MSKQTTKELLLTTAIRLFQERGFDNVTVDDVCKETDVTKTAFYYHYKSKDELIRDFFSVDHMLTTTELASILSATDYASQVLRIMEVRIRNVTQAGVALTKELYRIYLKDESIPLLSDKSELSDIIIMLIERAQTVGQIKNMASPELLHNSLCCLTNGIVLKWIMMDGSFDIIEENHRLYQTMFL
jgi:AcrR family transcriptional regulator